MVPTEQIQFARRILGSVRPVRFSEEPTIDIRDRLALLTVAAGLRDVAAFGFAERGNAERIQSLGHILSNHGLHCFITKQIRHRSHELERDSIGDLVEIFNRVDAETYAQHTGELLWVCREPGLEEQVQRVVDRQIESGTVLAYPACCIEHHDRVDANFQRAFATAIISAAGSDPDAVERALREDLKVEMEGDPTNSENMRRTDERFPFVFHVACDSCLSSDASPTAELNREYSRLAQQYDRAFHHYYEELTKSSVQIMSFISEAEAQDLRPDELPAQMQNELDDLFAARDRIYAKFF